MSCPSEVGSLHADVRSTGPGIWGVGPPSVINYLHAGPGVSFMGHDTE